MGAFRLGRIKITIHFNLILPKLMAIITRHPRYVPDFEWSYNWTYNAFRAYEHIFGRRAGIRAEMSSRVKVTDVVSEVTYAFHTWEAAIVFAEDKVREFFREWKFAPFKIYVPVLATPGGIPVFASPYIFAIAADATSNGLKNTAGTTWSVAHTISGSNTLLVVGWGSDGVTMSAADYNGTSMTSTVSETSQAKKCGMYHLLAPTTGTNNINMTRSASSGTIEDCHASYSGVAQSGQPDATATNTTNTASPIASSITTVAASCWVMMQSLLWAPTSQDAGSGTFKRVTAPDPAGDPNIFDLYDTNAAVSAGSNTLNVTYVGTISTAVSMCLASFAPVATTTRTISVSDQLNITDVVTIVVISNINTSDQLNVTESVTMLDIQNISVSDQIDITESATLEANNFISVNDQVNITESVTIFINPLFISVSDQLNITESVTTSLFQETLILSVSDQLDVTENVQMGLDNYISVNDELTISESVSFTLINNISVSDQLDMTESATPGLVSFINVSDQLDITESVTKTVSDPARGLSYMRGFDQNLPVTMTKQDYPLGFNDAAVS